MNLTRHGEEVVLSLNWLESRMIREVLQSISRNYEKKPGELDPAVARVWYSTRGCETARMPEEEVREYLETLHGFKQAHLQMLQTCIGQLGVRKGGRGQMRLPVPDVPAFVTVINDHRLLAAAQNQIGQSEMDLHSLREISRLNPHQQSALYEIHLLAYLMEELLRLCAGE